MKWSALIFFGTCCLCSAASLRFTWDVSPSAAVTGYYVYGFTNAVFNTTNAPALKVDVKTNLVAEVSELKPGLWTFAATAYNADGIESDFSNVVVTEVPKPPALMRTVTLQYTATLPTTNWQETGFFQIKIH